MTIKIISCSHFLLVINFTSRGCDLGLIFTIANNFSCQYFCLAVWMKPFRDIVTERKYHYTMQIDDRSYFSAYLGPAKSDFCNFAQIWIHQFGFINLDSSSSSSSLKWLVFKSMLNIFLLSYFPALV